MSDGSPLARLNKTDLRAIEFEVEQRLGTPPTINDLRVEDLGESRALNLVLDAIRGFGRILTLLTAEVIQSVGALAIATVFALLEYWRVHHGAVALGQNNQQAALIGFAVGTANVVWSIRSTPCVNCVARKSGKWCSRPCVGDG